MRTLLLGSMDPIRLKAEAEAYKLILPPKAWIHPTFHVSQLKKAIGSSVTPVSVPAQLTEEAVLVVKPEKIMDERFNANSGQKEILVKWKDQPDCGNSWEWKS